MNLYFTLPDFAIDDSYGQITEPLTDLIIECISEESGY